MAARERWVVVREHGKPWLHEGQGPGVSDRIVSRDELRRRYPRLFAELIRTDSKDGPRVVQERQR
jgi:hypothetical protein